LPNTVNFAKNCSTALGALHFYFQTVSKHKQLKLLAVVIRINKWFKESKAFCQIHSILQNIAARKEK
jgi:hypothetical protein